MTLHMPYPSALPTPCASAPVTDASNVNLRKRRRSESRPAVSISIPPPISTHTIKALGSASATLVTPPLSPPDESSFEATRAKYVENLIATTTRLLETLWPSPTTPIPCPASTSTRLTPLPQVISSLLRRSRTSCSTLHLSLLYLVRLRNAVVGRKTVRERIRSFSTPSASSPASSSSSATTPTQTLKHHPLLCPRRSFLTSLILAHKYLNDKALSNGAWARISGLGVQEINLAEREFLICVGYEVGVKEGVWERWCRGVGGWMRGGCGGSGQPGGKEGCVVGIVGGGGYPSPSATSTSSLDEQHKPIVGLSLTPFTFGSQLPTVSTSSSVPVHAGPHLHPSVTLTPQSEAGSDVDVSPEPAAVPGLLQYPACVVGGGSSLGLGVLNGTAYGNVDEQRAVKRVKVSESF
ncbi:hypothetical protein HK097_007101 [Rhizophlyctis rosea]|uniref:Cyclin-domain-containing protein n=1 Tax=Rhizophlyctis rosea TaxID=64517 RepID=A0AAD5SCF3_9FUNG|nr:hypothetical protein HK097_007101 [Rhizophlyctis rosea]